MTLPGTILVRKSWSENPAGVLPVGIPYVPHANPINIIVPITRRKNRTGFTDESPRRGTGLQTVGGKTLISRVGRPGTTTPNKTHGEILPRSTGGSIVWQRSITAIEVGDDVGPGYSEGIRQRRAVRRHDLRRQSPERRPHHTRCDNHMNHLTHPLGPLWLSSDSLTADEPIVGYFPLKLAGSSDKSTSASTGDCPANSIATCS